MLNKDLQQLGFTKNETTVYLTLVSMGQAKAGEILKKVGLHRNLVYLALEKLIERKLVGKMEVRGVAVYKALDPMRLFDEAKSKEMLTQAVIEELQIIQKKVSPQEITVYEGLEALRNYFVTKTQRSPEGATSYVIGTIGDRWYEIMGDAYEKYEKIRLEKKIRVKLISYRYSQKEQNQARPNNLVEIKVIPKNYEVPASIQVIGDVVALINYQEPYSLIEIKNPNLVEVYTQYFRLLWDNNVVTLRGAEGAQTFLNDTLNATDVYFIGGNGGIEKFHPEIWSEYFPKREAKKVFWHDLVDPDMNLTGLTENGKAVAPYYELRELPKTVSSPHVICIYGNKVANIVWKENSVINIIEDKDLAEGYLKYFHYLWNQEVRTYTGWKEIEGLYFEELISQQKKGDEEFVLTAGYGEAGADVRQKYAEFFVRYNTLRTKLGTHKKIIFFKKDRERAYKEFRDSNDPNFELVEFRFLPDEYYSAMQVAIIARKAVVTALAKTPIATVYEHPEVVASFKKQFDLLWDMGQP